MPCNKCDSPKVHFSRDGFVAHVIRVDTPWVMCALDTSKTPGNKNPLAMSRRLKSAQHPQDSHPLKNTGVSVTRWLISEQKQWGDENTDVCGRKP